MSGPMALHETVQSIQQQPQFKNILETSSTDQGYQQMAYRRWASKMSYMTFLAKNTF